MERNTEHLLAIADQIRNEPETLNMERWDPIRGLNDESSLNGGTASCIGGWSQALRGVSRPDEHPSDAFAAMGLTEEEGLELCYDSGALFYRMLPRGERGERFADILTAIAHGADVGETLDAAWIDAGAVTA